MTQLKKVKLLFGMTGFTLIFIAITVRCFIGFPVVFFVLLLYIGMTLSLYQLSFYKFTCKYYKWFVTPIFLLLPYKNTIIFILSIIMVVLVPVLILLCILLLLNMYWPPNSMFVLSLTVTLAGILSTRKIIMKRMTILINKWLGMSGLYNINESILATKTLLYSFYFIFWMGYVMGITDTTNYVVNGLIGFLAFEQCIVNRKELIAIIKAIKINSEKYDLKNLENYRDKPDNK